MKKLTIAFVLLFSAISLFGQIAGPNNGSSFANIAIPGSNKSWINTGNAAASDNSYSTYGTLTGSSPSYTDYLQATGFGFSIPSGVTINGIVVEAERSDPNQRTADYRIRIVKGAVIGATERSSGAGYGGTDAYQSYGNSGDLWGETWTETDINSADFGVAIAAIRTVSGANAGQVDHIRITVFYDFINLPVKLNSFTAKKNLNKIELNWITYDESNMNRYEVERSVDGNNFTVINVVSSLNQHSQTSYTSMDEYPTRGINYYRLKMIENTGKITYSKIIMVHFSSDGGFLLYPNPWQKGTVLNISNISGEEIRADFYTAGGALIGTVSSAGRTVPVTPLLNSKGLIFYTLTNQYGKLIGKGTLLVN